MYTCGQLIFTFQVLYHISILVQRRTVILWLKQARALLKTLK